MDLSTKLIQRLLLPNGGYQKTEQIIIETIIEHPEDEWLKMESLFEDESYDITKEDKKKYDDLEEAISILEEHRDTMMYIMKMAENKEKEENNTNNNDEDGCDERVNQHLEFEVDYSKLQKCCPLRILTPCKNSLQTKPNSQKIISFNRKQLRQLNNCFCFVCGRRREERKTVFFCQSGQHFCNSL
jgi:hypothetical protein